MYVRLSEIEKEMKKRETERARERETECARARESKKETNEGTKREREGKIESMCVQTRRVKIERDIHTSRLTVA